MIGQYIVDISYKQADIVGKNNRCAKIWKYLLHSSLQVPENSNAIYELNIAKRHFPVEKCNRKYGCIYVIVPQPGAGEYISRFGEVENLRYFWRRKIDLQLKYFYWNKFSTFPLEKSIEWLAAAAGFKFGWISTEAGIGQSWTNFCAWIFARPSIYRLTAEETPGLRHEMW